jgi:phosphatidylinositol alpha-mannosyltransferase
MDAFAASIYKSLKGTPFVHYMFDRFYPRYYITKYGRLVFSRCIKTASGIATISNFVSNDLKEKFGVEGVVIPGTVDVENFTICKNKDIHSPYILSTSSLYEPRKRIGLLVKAFELLLNHVPHAVLKLSGHTSPERTNALLESVSPRTRNAIEILGVGRRDDLPKLYRDAAISVLPSVDEAFGLIILESLASGTPVVGTRSGGIPDILTDSRTGILFEETDEPKELCKALLKGIELSRNPKTRIMCRKHAEQYSWSKIGPQYEKFYLDILDRKQRKQYGTKRKKKKEKKITVHTQTRGGPFKRQFNNGALALLFDDALDELDIDYDTYYRYDLYKPFCTYILEWLVSNGVREGKVLVVGHFMSPLTILLKKVGFTVSGIGVTRKIEPWKYLENHMLISDLHVLKDLPQRYDLVICDDIFKYNTYPKNVLQILREKLKPEGIFILTSENAADGKVRLFVNMGKNTNHEFNDDVSNESLTPDDQKKIGVYRRYCLEEVKSLVSDAGFSIEQSNYIIKEKAIENSLFPFPVFLYLFKTFSYYLQRAIPSFRSHVFVVAKKKFKLGS